VTQEYSFDREPDVQRGTVFALVAVPAGIIAYVALYEVGFIASVVAFGVAWLATLLYRYGSGQEVNRTGAVRVAIITLATIVAAIAAGIIWDVAGLVADDYSTSPFTELTSPDFWPYLVYDLSDWEYFRQYIPDILIGLLFGIIGCFSTLRAAFGRPGSRRRHEPPTATPNETPQTPTRPDAQEPTAPPRFGVRAEDDEPR